jgi:hypothetical protein
MDKFLRKHDIDVGKTLGVIFLAIMAWQIYEFIIELLFTPPFIIDINLGIPILFFPGLGMYRHNNVARKWTLVLTWVTLILLIIFLVLCPFLQEKITVSIGGKEIANPPFWKLLVTVMLFFPLLWVFIAALRSQKALEEFRTAEPVAQADRKG